MDTFVLKKHCEEDDDHTEVYTGKKFHSLLFFTWFTFLVLRCFAHEIFLSYSYFVYFLWVDFPTSKEFYFLWICCHFTTILHFHFQNSLSEHSQGPQTANHLNSQSPKCVIGYLRLQNLSSDVFQLIPLIWSIGFLHHPAL